MTSWNIDKSDSEAFAHVPIKILPTERFMLRVLFQYQAVLCFVFSLAYGQTAY